MTPFVALDPDLVAYDQTFAAQVANFVCLLNYHSHLDSSTVKIL